MQRTTIYNRLILTAAALLVLLAAPPRLTAQPADRFATLAPAMQKFVDQGQIAGVVTLVADKDRVLHQAAVGVSDIATGRKMQLERLA